MRDFKRIPMLHNLYEITADGKCFRRVSTKKELKISEGANYGYSQVVITLNQRYPDEDILRLHPKAHKNGVFKNGLDTYQLTLKVHQLVYEAHIGAIPFGMVIDHIDRNKSNNDKSNLRAVTQSENQQNRPDSKTGISGMVRVSFEGTAKDFPTKDQAIRYVSEQTGRSYRHCFNQIYDKGKYGGYVVTRIGKE